MTAAVGGALSPAAGRPSAWLGTRPLSAAPCGTVVSLSVTPASDTPARK